MVFDFLKTEKFHILLTLRCKLRRFLTFIKSKKKENHGVLKNCEETFKYHLTLRGMRFAQTVRLPSYEKGVMAKSSCTVTFIVAEKV